MNDAQQMSTPEGGVHRPSPQRSPSPESSRRGSIGSILPEQGKADQGSRGVGEEEETSNIVK